MKYMLAWTGLNGSIGTRRFATHDERWQFINKHSRFWKSWTVYMED